MSKISPRLLAMSADRQLARRPAGSCHRARRVHDHADRPAQSIAAKVVRANARFDAVLFPQAPGILLGVDQEFAQVFLAAILLDSSTRESDPRTGSTGSHPLWVYLSSHHRLSFMFMAQRR